MSRMLKALVGVVRARSRAEKVIIKRRDFMLLFIVARTR